MTDIKMNNKKFSQISYTTSFILNIYHGDVESFRFT